MENSPEGTDEDAAAAEIRILLRCARQGSLATLDTDAGHPYVSLVLVATASDGAPVMLLSSLARHTRNLLQDARVSLLLTQGAGGNPLVRSRVTLVGRIAADNEPEDLERFLLRQPEAAGYAGFGDFRLFRLEPESAHLVAGFGRIETVAAGRFMMAGPVAAAAVRGEKGAVAHMNADHRDALALYAQAFLDAPGGGQWQMDGFDRDGMEISSEGRVRYLPFPAPIDGAGDLRRTLVAMAGRARLLTGGRTIA
jgi:putative heme iron utilization protein